MSDLFSPGKTNMILSTTIFTQTNRKIWKINYFLQGISNIEPDPLKVKDIGNIKQI